MSTTIEISTTRSGEFSMISHGGTNTYRIEDTDPDSPFTLVMNTVGPNDASPELLTAPARVTVTIEYDLDV